jgi:Zn-dependent protease/CBS domain-containing protein
MRTTYRLTRILGINIDVHFTFLLLLFLFAIFFGTRGLLLISGIFFFVTFHELSHSIAASYFGIKVSKITLLPIGGVASIPELPSKPYQELIISLAGPISNILVLIVFYYPLKILLGQEALLYPLKLIAGTTAYTGQISVLAHIYWINLVLAAFNLIPAFPMDGGRVLRAALCYRMDYKKATRAAVKVGHIFALIFAFYGIVYGHIFLLIIAVFIYTAASSEGFQVSLAETIKRYKVRDVLPSDFLKVETDTPIYRILEMMFHTHQEDFPVMREGKLEGIITRREVTRGMHEKGNECLASDIMRTDVPTISKFSGLDVARKRMYKYNTKALVVEDKGNIIGMVTVDDINRIYVLREES